MPPNRPNRPLHIRVLGCSGSIAQHCRTTSFLIDGDLLVDAGTGVGDLPLPDMAAINHVVLTHGHLDHVAALPLMLDSVASLRTEPLTVHALPDTLAALQRHIFNNVIWPDFTALPTPERPFLKLVPFEIGQTLVLAGKHIEVLPAIHSVPAVGFAVSRSEGACWVFSGDTGHNPAFWRRVNQLDVGALVIETAFSERELPLALRSLHLSPSLLAQQLDMMHPEARFPVFISHTKPAETHLIMREIDTLQQQRQHQGLTPVNIGWLQTGQELTV